MLVQNHQGEHLQRCRIADLTFTQIRYAPRLELPRHSHDKAAFCLVLDGHYREQFSRRRLECSSDTVLFRPAAEPHSDHFGDDGGLCLLIEPDPPWLDHVREHTAALDHPAKVDGGLAARLARGLLRQWNGQDDLAPLSIEGLALELAAEFARSLAVDTGPAVPRWLRHARDLLDASHDQPLTLDFVARTVGVHPVHLAREFRRRYHGTVAAYVRQRRVEHACRLLRGSDLPLVQIALKVGFAHQAHFTRVFRKLTGTTPAVYRAQVSAR